MKLFFFKYMLNTNDCSTFDVTAFIHTKAILSTMAFAYNANVPIVKKKKNSILVLL